MRVINDKVTYKRFGLNRREYKNITYDAYFLNNDTVLNGKQNIKKNPNFYSQAGIDKIGLCLPLDYLNEDISCFYSNGPFSTRKHGGCFHIDIHGEYLDSMANLLIQTESIIDILLIKGFFKIPIQKSVVEFNPDTGLMEGYSQAFLQKSVVEFNPDTGEVTNTSETQYSEIPENCLQFKQIILNKLSLTNLELKFDTELRLQQLLKQSDFNTFSDTLYSKDYHYYNESNRKKSFLCIYDKTKQEHEVKKYDIGSPVNRFEIRLFSASLKYHGGVSLLNNTFAGLYSSIEQLLIKKLSKLYVDFSMLTEALPTDSPLQKLLSKVVYSETETEDEKPIDDLDIEFCPMPYHHNKTAIQQAKTFFYSIKTLCQGPLNLLCVVARGP